MRKLNKSHGLQCPSDLLDERVEFTINHFLHVLVFNVTQVMIKSPSYLLVDQSFLYRFLSCKHGSICLVRVLLQVLHFPPNPRPNFWCYFRGRYAHAMRGRWCAAQRRNAGAPPVSPHRLVRAQSMGAVCCVAVCAHLWTYHWQAPHWLDPIIHALSNGPTRPTVAYNSRSLTLSDPRVTQYHNNNNNKSPSNSAPTLLYLTQRTSRDTQPPQDTNKTSSAQANTYDN
jgi:hypothetical protein